MKALPKPNGPIQWACWPNPTCSFPRTFLVIVCRTVLRSSTRSITSEVHLLFLPLKMSETEMPFQPREKLIEKQKYFQSLQRHTYLKGPFDKITSVAIPLALAGASLFMIGRGIYNMSHGIGKKE